MDRKALWNFARAPQSNDDFIVSIDSEIRKFERCSRTAGASCPIHLTGNISVNVSIQDVFRLENFLKEHGDVFAYEYILTGILLDDCFEKGDDVVDLLQDLIS